MEDKPTPSSLGDIDATVPTSIPETIVPLSVRSDADSVTHSHTAIHHAHSEALLQPHLTSGASASMHTIQPSALTVESVEDAPAGSVRLGPSEFAVTLPMDSRVKDDYDRVLTDSAEITREFLASLTHAGHASDSQRGYLSSKMHEVIAKLNNVSTHPDLNIAHHVSYEDSKLAREAEWAEYSSAKFRLLGWLIRVGCDRDLHIILAVQGEDKRQILERYLLGKGFTHTKPRDQLGGSLEVSLQKDSLSFAIHSEDGVQEMFKPPSAIFVFDTSYKLESPAVQHLRTTYTRNGMLLPVIWFLVSNTCEHIERCLPQLPEPERLRLLMHYTDYFHDDVGDLQDDALNVCEDAEEILNYLSDSFASWSLPAIEPLHFVSANELESATPSSEEQVLGTQKRSLDDEQETEDYISKRARVNTQDTSQMTQSTKPPSQTLDRDLASLERSLIQMKATHDTEKEQLQRELLQTRARLQEFETALGVLQHRYEARTKELHLTRQDRDRLSEGKASMEQRIEKQREDIFKLKEERSQLKAELEGARQELKNGGGSLAELETAREEIRRLTSEKASLERKAEYEKNQAEYTREQYQTASTVAAQAGNELRQVRDENEALTRKVQGNTVQLREMNIKNDAVRHLARINELELILASRDDLLRKKEDELREIRKNRPSTRSTSTQPRSPKWAASSRPTSPGVGHNGNGNGLAGRGSALRFSSEMPF
ncbi:putative HDA1 complex subunit [Penicillium brasilianum]|uniref:Putative HDA1 complex subunit n=1 Tax=Penicillium brasilianum TaxID=104259 RepID=A0A1S9RJC0_PENBI|nr:putative HDA1 complex subunit [Penicillium brasilianum]